VWLVLSKRASLSWSSLTSESTFRLSLLNGLFRWLHSSGPLRPSLSGLSLRPGNVYMEAYGRPEKCENASNYGIYSTRSKAHLNRPPKRPVYSRTLLERDFDHCKYTQANSIYVQAHLHAICLCLSIIIIRGWLMFGKWNVDEILGLGMYRMARTARAINFDIDHLGPPECGVVSSLVRTASVKK
jgi:hypothetical protein